MKDKEKAIIEAAIKLFATKGFASTSIQEIVTESGISKGAFYLYFKSKDALLIAILEYYFDRVQKNVEAFKNEEIPPREKFLKQLLALFNTLLEHKEFIIMQSREQAIPLNETVKKLMFMKHYNTHRFYQESLLAIYGNEVEPHLWDLSLMLDGLFHSYIRLLFFNQNNFDVNELVQYIVKRMDSIVVGVIDESPIVTEEMIEELFKKTKPISLRNDEDLKELIAKMKQELSKLEDRNDLEVSLEVLESEIQKEKPRIPVIQGMLSNFKGLNIFEYYREEIAGFYNIKL